MRALWFSYIIFAYLTTLIHVISKFVTSNGGSVPQCVMWNHNESVKYSGGPGLPRKQGQVTSHYFQYSLTRSQKYKTCLTRGNMKTDINTVNPKNCQENLFESFVS